MKEYVGLTLSQPAVRMVVIEAWAGEAGYRPSSGRVLNVGIPGI